MIQEDEGLIPEVERVTDLLDKASVMEAETMRQARLEHSRRMKRDQEPTPDSTLNQMADAKGIMDPIDRADFMALSRWATTECDECGLEIGEGRLNAAIRNRLCFHCATAEEVRKKR